MKLSAFFIAACAYTALVGSASAETMTPAQARGNEGSNVIVEGMAQIHQDPSRSGTDVEVVGRDKSQILGFIPQGNESAIPDLASYDGKVVDLAGVVQSSDGEIEIRITSPRQLALASPG